MRDYSHPSFSCSTLSCRTGITVLTGKRRIQSDGITLLQISFILFSSRPLAAVCLLLGQFFSRVFSRNTRDRLKCSSLLSCYTGRANINALLIAINQVNTCLRRLNQRAFATLLFQNCGLENKKKKLALIFCSLPLQSLQRTNTRRRTLNEL